MRRGCFLSHQHTGWGNRGIQTYAVRRAGYATQKHSLKWQRRTGVQWLSPCQWCCSVFWQATRIHSIPLLTSKACAFASEADVQVGPCHSSPPGQDNYHSHRLHWHSDGHSWSMNEESSVKYSRSLVSLITLGILVLQVMWHRASCRKCYTNKCPLIFVSYPWFLLIQLAPIDFWGSPMFLLGLEKMAVVKGTLQDKKKKTSHPHNHSPQILCPMHKHIHFKFEEHSKN